MVVKWIVSCCRLGGGNNEREKKSVAAVGNGGFCDMMPVYLYSRVELLHAGEGWCDFGGH